MPELTPKIIRSRRSTISLLVTEEGTLIVKAPFYLPTPLIQKFLDEKENWINKSLQKVHATKPYKKMYTEGEEFMVLGKTYKLHFTDSKKITLTPTTLQFPKFLTFRIQKELEAWYIKNAKKIIKKRVEHYAKLMKTNYKSILLSDTKSKWGTCFEDNSLQFNWRLLMAPLMVLDYVVIHELAHTSEKHHRAEFWRKVRFFTPAYKQHRKWLDRNMRILTI